jgi:hypothetical protein
VTREVSCSNAQELSQPDAPTIFEDNSVLPREILPRDPVVYGSPRVELPDDFFQQPDSLLEDKSVLLQDKIPNNVPEVNGPFIRVEPDFCVLLDSQASVSVFREPLLLNFIRQSPSTKRVGGISSEEAILIDKIGDHPDFGTVFFNPHATANVLCQYDMANIMDYKIELDVKAHRYKMSGTKTGTVYVFSESNKLAVCTCLPASQLVKSICSNYDDASLGVHSDYEGHAELVATSELLPQLIHFRDFFSELGFKETNPRVQANIELDNALTKPLQEGNFKRLRKKLLNAE